MSVVLRSLGHCLPERIVTSEQLEAEVRDASPGVRLGAGLIKKLSGVAERRVVRPGTNASDLAVAAADAALTAAATAPSDVDVVIFAAASHDMAEPATANVVQAALGCSNAGVFDVKNACNSFLNGLDVASALIESGRAETVLVTNGETLSLLANLHIADESELRWKLAALTLGDAGAAAVLTAGDERPGETVLGRAGFLSFGESWHKSVVLGGGSRAWRDLTRTYFECDAAGLHELALEHLPKMIRAVADQAGWPTEEVDCVVPHQVSIAIVRDIASAVGIPFERCVVTLQEVGNTAAASIPVALGRTVATGGLAPGSRVLLVGGAAGFSVGVLPLVWGETPCRSVTAG